MNIQDLDVLSLLPQKPPFVMIDKMVYLDDLVVKTEFLITDTNIFCADGKLMEAGLIENVAQTCAVRMGYQSLFLQNEKVKVGFIGSIKNFEINRLPLVNETISTVVTIVNNVFNMTLIEASTKVNDKPISNCEMKIFLTDTSSN